MGNGFPCAICQGSTNGRAPTSYNGESVDDKKKLNIKENRRNKSKEILGPDGKGLSNSSNTLPSLEQLYEKKQDELGDHSMENNHLLEKITKLKDSTNKMYYFGEKVQIRNNEEDWKSGIVTKSGRSPQVKLDESDSVRTWDEIRPFESKDSKTIVFRPGRMGINWIGREVNIVYPGSQAEKLGIQVGWRALTINGKDPHQDVVGTITQYKSHTPDAGIQILFQIPPPVFFCNQKVLILKGQYSGYFAIIPEGSMGRPKVNDNGAYLVSVIMEDGDPAMIWKSPSSIESMNNRNAKETHFKRYGDDAKNNGHYYKAVFYYFKYGKVDLKGDINYYKNDRNWKDVLNHLGNSKFEDFLLEQWVLGLGEPLPDYGDGIKADTSWEICEKMWKDRERSSYPSAILL